MEGWPLNAVINTPLSRKVRIGAYATISVPGARRSRAPVHAGSVVSRHRQHSVHGASPVLCQVRRPLAVPSADDRFVERVSSTLISQQLHSNARSHARIEDSMKIIESTQSGTQAAKEPLNVVREIEQESADTGDKIAGATGV